MNADWPERPWIRVKNRKQITPDERVPLELSDHERELILKHTFAGDDLTGRLRIVRRPGEPPVYRFTLDDLDELAGHVAAEANHAKDKKLEKQLHRLFARIAAVLESYTDETDGSTRSPTTRMSKPKRSHIREGRIRNEAIVDANGPEEQAMGWYYYLENKLRFPLSGQVHRCQGSVAAQKGRNC